MARTWTEEEEEIIRKEVERNPNNLREAFFYSFTKNRQNRFISMHTLLWSYERTKRS